MNSVYKTPAIGGYQRVLAIRDFSLPRGKVRIVASRIAGDSVAHASLIFHQHCYNPLIAAWYDQIQAPRLFAAV